MLRLTGLILYLIFSFPAFLAAQEGAVEKKSVEAQEVVLAEGSLLLKVPGSWKKVQPKFNMIEAEFSVPKLEAGSVDGRVTMMQSGGSIEQNLDRWYSQFEMDGEPGEPVVKEFNKVKVHMVDLKGTFLDTMGTPGGPATKKENYRMLAAIVELPEGKYFVKCYGPAAVIEKNVEDFKKMMESVRAVQ